MISASSLATGAVSGTGLFPLAAENPVAESQVAAEVADRDHGQAPAGERVVGVVPFGPLRVEPDAAIGNEVAELDQERHQQFLRERDQDDLAAVVRQQFPIGSPVAGSATSGVGEVND